MMSMVMDGIIIVLLTATIFYSVRLNAKLNMVRSQKDDLAKNMAAFDEAANSAIIAVEELQVKGENVCRQIEAAIKKGQITADDIEFLIDRAAKRAKEFEAKAAAKPAGNVGGYSEAELVKLFRQKQSQIAIN